MKIALDGRMLLPHMTGIGRYLLGLAGALRKLPTGDRFELWLQSGLPDDHPVWSLQPVGLTLRRLPAAHLSLRQAWVLPAAVRRYRPDLLHYPHFDLPLGTPGRIVATLHDLKYIARPEFFPRRSGIKRAAILAAMKVTWRRARRIIAPSESTRRDILRYLGVDPHRVIAIPHGVDAVFFRGEADPAGEAVRRRYGLARPFILFVGERRPHKNLAGLVRVYAQFRRSARQPYDLVIAGKAYTGYHAPERLVEELDLQDRVHFLDHFPEEDLPALYRAAEAFTLLSCYEGFGLTALEAMASGTPVVAANCTALPEIVGEAGLLVPPDQPAEAAEALLSVISGGERREACIEMGLTRARAFTWERCAAATHRVYREALEA